jgi:hypothetical protein
VIDRWRPRLPRPEREAVAGAGHVPHLTHLADYAMLSAGDERLLKDAAAGIATTAKGRPVRRSGS